MDNATQTPIAVPVALADAAGAETMFRATVIGAAIVGNAGYIAREDG